ncbi:MAG: glycerate kinase [Caldiserica bacterium]|nr:glycerate kinase [Caldisericota bacterium]
MKLLFAPDSYKGSLSVDEVCAILWAAAAECMPNVQCKSLPIADGGEGMVRGLLAACGELISCRATDPLGEGITAQYAILPDGSAAIEMAAASGLPLVPKGRFFVSSRSLVFLKISIPQLTKYTTKPPESSPSAGSPWMG